MAGTPIAILGLFWTFLVAPLAPRVAALGLLALALRQLRLYPRKTVDIGWWDLAAAVRFALLPGPSRSSLEASISRQWSERGDAFACLSVRTGIDLLLRALALPKGSEVLFVPGISIPAVVDIVRSHGLHPVGVDPPSGKELLVSELKQHITEGTRAAVVTHLFGAVFDAAPLIREAKARGLFVIEDCAQAFLGAAGQTGGQWHSGFRGHEEADATFVSFGLMKTLTALGGAVCSVRDTSLRESVLQLQASYPVRPCSQFLKVALKAFAIKLIGNPYLWGLSAALVSATGMDFDSFIVGSVRGFPNAESFRLRPSAPLLQLLLRRLRSQACAAYDAGRVASTVAQRRTNGALIAERLAEEGTTAISLNAGTQSWWLLPVSDEEPRRLVQELWARGFDATCSSTQLMSVEKGTSAHSLMRSVVYLPVTPELPRRAARALAEAVLDVQRRRHVVATTPLLGKATPRVAGGRVATGLALLATTLVLWPTAVLCWVPSGRWLLALLAASASATFVLMVVARILAAEPRLRASREVLLALSKKNRLEGAAYWRSAPALEGRINGAVLITGSTGFVGGGVLFALLARAEELGLTRVVVLIRRKAGSSAAARLAELRASDAFEEVLEAFDRLVVVLEGDTAQVDFGWEEPQRPWPYDEPLRAVLHCAGDVRFNQPLQQAAVSLISGTLQVVQLAARWKAQRLVTISTAFAHAVPSATDFLAERLVELRDFDAMELYRDAVNHGGWAEKAMSDLGFPNTYTFAKAVGEHLVVRACAASGLDVRIVRPSIVGPAWAAPYAGWCGDKPSTIVGAAALLAGRGLRLFRCSAHPCPLVPVDLVADASVKALLGVSGSLGGRVMHATVDASEAERVLSFHSLVVLLLQVLALHGDLLLPEAGLLCRLARWAEGPWSFWLLHVAVNLLPSLLMALGGGRRGRALARYSTLPVQYLPFSSPASAWLFRSSLRLPENWDATEYGLLIHKAAISFARGRESKRAAPLGHVAGSLLQELRVVSPKPVWRDALETFCLPGSPLGLSAVAFLSQRGLQWMDLTVSVDAASLAAVMDLSDPLALCPTHRSLLDFVIIALTCFHLQPLLPALQVPHVAADAEFARLPVLGRVLAGLGAFFLRRGGGEVQPDPALRAEVGRVFRKGRPLEVFLEGLRSRGRRQMRLRTGFLRALRDVSQRAVVLVPVALSYELLPEDRSFHDELRGLPRPPLSGLALLDWALRGIRGELPAHGSAHVRLGSPQLLDGSSNLQQLLSGVQEQLVGLTSLTELHGKALAETLSLPAAAVCGALRGAGLPMYPSRLGGSLQLSEAQRWALALQAAVLLHRRLPRPWARWLVEPVVERRRPGAQAPVASELEEEVAQPAKANAFDEERTLDVDGVVAHLQEQLELAVEHARAAAVALRESGMAEITEEHLLQQLLQDSPLPAPLARGAASIVAAQLGRECAAATPATQPEPAAVAPLWPAASMQVTKQCNEEALDRWGFRDTKFVAQWVDGQPAAQITSQRYGAVGRRPSHRLWSLFQAELRVPMVVRGTLPDLGLPEVPPPSPGLLECLAAVVPAPRVSHSADARLRACTGHGLTDIWKLRTCSVLRVPDAVVRPECEEEVLAILQAAANCLEGLGFAVVPVGGRTNVTSATACPSQSIEPRPFVALDMRGLSRVLSVSAEDGVAHVEAGITGSALKEALASKGVTMGMEPDSMELSTLGGWIATRASGMKRAKYGNIEDMLMEVRLATPQGMLWQRHGGPGSTQAAFARTSTNVDLTGLALGSEGCLGVVTSAVVRVRPVPEAVEYQSVVFPDWASGAAWMREVARLPPALQPASCRLMDNKQLQLSQALREDVPSARNQLRGALRSGWLRARGVNLTNASAATLAFEGLRSEVALQKRALTPLVRRAGGVWGGSSSGEAGYALTFAIAYLRDFGLDHRILSESLETMAPWSVVAGIWPAVVSAVQEQHRVLRVPGQPFLSCRVTQLYNQGAVLYMYLAVSTAGLEASRALEVFQHLEHTARQAVLDAGGCLSHHHGVGKLRAALLPAGQAPELSAALRGLKVALDPCGVLGARNGPWAEVAAAASPDEVELDA